MSPRPDPAAARADEHSLLAAFVSVLALEEQALVDGDPDSVAALALEKSAYLDRLAALPRAGAPSPELAALREKARLANDRNGRLIALRLARLRERLDVVAGRDDPGAVYGADGFARTRLPASPSQRTLG